MNLSRSVWVLFIAILVSLQGWAQEAAQQVVPQATPAQVQPQVAQESDPAVALSYRVEHLKKAFLSGNDASIRGAVQEVELLRRVYGTLDVTPLVEAMALWARQQGDSGNPELGLLVIQTVERWAPNRPVLLGSRVILLRQQGLKGYFLGMPDVVELMMIRLSTPVHRWLWILQHVAWLRMMAAILLWGWAFTLAMRYRNVIRYLWEGHLIRKVPGVPAAIIGAIILTFPVLFGLDPSVMAVYWLWIMAPFMYRPEVRITVFVLLLQLAHPALVLLEPEGSVMPAPSVASLQYQPRVRPMEEQGIKQFSPVDQEFLKGWRQLQAQDWAGAEITFGALSVRHPDRAAVFNNRGVARFQQGRTSQAKMDFDMAASLTGGNPAPEILLNQSVIAFSQLDSLGGSAKVDEARRIDADLVNALMNANQSRSDLRTFPSPLPETPERQEALRQEKTPPLAPIAERAKRPEILLNLMIPIIGLLAFIVRLARSVKQAHPTQCTRCGEPFHTTDSPDAEVCSKCHHLFLLKDGLHGESRKKKVQDVAAFQSKQGWIHRTLVVLAPGLDLCFLGDATEGFLEYSFLAFAAGLVFATGRSVRFPGEVIADPPSTWQTLGLILLAILFVRSWFKLLPRRTR
jgi:hypothetical protein